MICKKLPASGMLRANLSQCDKSLTQEINTLKECPECVVQSKWEQGAFVANL